LAVVAIGLGQPLFHQAPVPAGRQFVGGTPRRGGMTDRIPQGSRA
jgi:hypothetical protein